MIETHNIVHRADSITKTCKVDKYIATAMKTTAWELKQVKEPQMAPQRP